MLLKEQLCGLQEMSIVSDALSSGSRWDANAGSAFGVRC